MWTWNGFLVLELKKVTLWTTEEVWACILDNTIVIMQDALIFRSHLLKYSGVKCQEVLNFQMEKQWRKGKEGKKEEEQESNGNGRRGKKGKKQMSK